MFLVSAELKDLRVDLVLVSHFKEQSPHQTYLSILEFQIWGGHREIRTPNQAVICR